MAARSALDERQRAARSGDGEGGAGDGGGDFIGDGGGHVPFVVREAGHPAATA